MKCSKYFGAKWRGFIKSESILAPKGASRFKTQNIRYDTCTDNRGRKYWPKRYTDENDTQGQGPTSPISALKIYVTPLLGSRSVLTQIIPNLCQASLMTCSKIYNIIAPGEKVRPRINIRTGNQTKSWLFDTGAAITYMNSRSFNAAFGNQKPKKIANAQSCVAASETQ
jgi:hypothetical protein